MSEEMAERRGEVLYRDQVGKAQEGWARRIEAIVREHVPEQADARIGELLKALETGVHLQNEIQVAKLYGALKARLPGHVPEIRDAFGTTFDIKPGDWDRIEANAAAGGIDARSERHD